MSKPKETTCFNIRNINKGLHKKKCVRVSITSVCFKTSVVMLLLSTASLFHEREVSKRSGSSAPPELKVMNRLRPNIVLISFANITICHIIQLQ